MDWIGWEGGWADPHGGKLLLMVWRKCWGGARGEPQSHPMGMEEHLELPHWLLLDGVWLSGRRAGEWWAVTPPVPLQEHPPCTPGGFGTLWLLALGQLEQPWEGPICSCQMPLQWRPWVLGRAFPTLLPLTAFTCKVLVAPCEEKRNSAGNLRALGVLGNCYLSITKGQSRLDRTGCSGVTDGKLGAGDDGASPSAPPQPPEETGPASTPNAGEGQYPSHLPLAAAAVRMNHQPLPLCPFGFFV